MKEDTAAESATQIQVTNEDKKPEESMEETEGFKGPKTLNLKW